MKNALKFIKNWKKIYIISVIIVLFFSLAYILVVIFGKAIVLAKLEAFTNKKVSINSIILRPPFALEVKGLNIEGVAKVERIFIAPSIPYLAIGRLAFNKVEVIKPEITYERPVVQTAIRDNKPVVIEDARPVISAPPATLVAEPAKIPVRVIFKQVIVKSGKLNFVDHTAAGPGGLRVTVKDINLKLVNFYTFASKAVMRFSLEGKIPWQGDNPDGKIAFKGWIDYHKKNMQANLNIENIDGVALHPYYSTWVDLEKARIEKAKLNFKANIEGANNNVTAACRLELVDIVRKPRAPEEPQEKAERITDAVLDMFKSMNQGKVVLDFTLRTKMSRPEFGFSNIKSAFEDKLMDARRERGFKFDDAIMLPGKLLSNGYKSGKNLFNAVMDGIFALGNEAKKVLEIPEEKGPVINKN